MIVSYIIQMYFNLSQVNVSITFSSFFKEIAHTYQRNIFEFDESEKIQYFFINIFTWEKSHKQKQISSKDLKWGMLTSVLPFGCSWDTSLNISIVIIRVLLYSLAMQNPCRLKLSFVLKFWQAGGKKGNLGIFSLYQMNIMWTLKYLWILII